MSWSQCILTILFYLHSQLNVKLDCWYWCFQYHRCVRLQFWRFYVCFRILYDWNLFYHLCLFLYFYRQNLKNDDCKFVIFVICKWHQFISVCLLVFNSWLLWDWLYPFLILFFSPGYHCLTLSLLLVKLNLLFYFGDIKFKDN